MRNLIRHACVPLVLLLAIASPAVGVENDLKERVEQRIQEEIQARQIVGLSVGLSFQGRPIETLHYGFENREKKIEASDDTMYRWASISKPLTAVVAMQLAAEDTLDLDRDVREYVLEFPEKPWPITARQLLCHQGGVVHYRNGEVIRTERDYDKANPFKDVVLALDTFNKSPLVAQPGTSYSYTTHGYILLGAVVQRAGDETFANLVTQRIATPLGMTTLRPDYQWEQIEHRAVGYQVNPFKQIIRSGNSDVSWKLPGGGFISNVGDLTRFGAGMIDGTLVDDETRALMWTAQATDDGSPTNYGLGFNIVTHEGRLIASHSGSQQKAATFLLMDPEAGLVVALMCNTEGVRLRDLARDLDAMIVEYMSN